MKLLLPIIIYITRLIRESPPPLITNIQLLFVDIAKFIYAKFIYHDQGYISKTPRFIG